MYRSKLYLSLCRQERYELNPDDPKSSVSQKLSSRRVIWISSVLIESVLESCYYHHPLMRSDTKLFHIRSEPRVHQSVISHGN